MPTEASESTSSRVRRPFVILNLSAAVEQLGWPDTDPPPGGVSDSNATPVPD
jgi:hypothetical protein